MRREGLSGLAMRCARARRSMLDVSATVALSSILTVGLLWPSRRLLANPIGGGDALAYYATGFMGQTSKQFGYPFGMRPFPYFPNTDLTQRTLATAIQLFTGDRFLSVNLVWVLSFPLTALAALWVIRLAGANRLLAPCLAVSFSFVPYHIFRGMEHIYLAAMWAVPLAIGLGVLTGTGKVPEFTSASWHRRSALVALCLVVAWSGIYYAFFACLILISAWIWLAARGESRRTLIQSAIPFALVSGAVMVVLIGAAIANAADPPTTMVASRQPSESALYSGNLAFALTPSPLTQVPLLGGLTAHFDAYVQPDIEGHGYGQFGSVVSTLSAITLVIGIVLLSRRRRTEKGLKVSNHHPPLSLYLAMLAAALLFFVPWSTNFLFALLITPEIRSWDRLLPTILLLLMVGAVSAMRTLVPRVSYGWNAAMALVLVGLTLLDGVAPYSGVIRSHFQREQHRVRMATVYAERVNGSVPKRCGVLQLPYVPFPEKAMRIAGMADYEHFLVALTNPRKQWSYGGVKYTTASEWAHVLSDQLTYSSVRSLVEGGFCGVHLDRIGYAEARAASLAESVERLLGPPMAEGHGRRWLFFALPNMGGVTHDVRDRPRLTPSAERLFYPGQVGP